MQYVWLSLTLVLGALQIVAAVLLIRERHLGPWMMLVGACISMLTGIANQIIGILGFPFGIGDHIEVFYQILGGIGWLAWLGFTIGLLLYALNRRSLNHRIADLERLVESQQG